MACGRAYHFVVVVKTDLSDCIHQCNARPLFELSLLVLSLRLLLIAVFVLHCDSTRCPLSGRGMPQRECFELSIQYVDNGKPESLDPGVAYSGTNTESCSTWRYCSTPTVSLPCGAWGAATVGPTCSILYIAAFTILLGFTSVPYSPIYCMIISTP